MASVQSVTHNPDLNKWFVSLSSPALSGDTFNISVTHSSGFTFFPSSTDCYIIDPTPGAVSGYVVSFTGKGLNYVGITSFTISLGSLASPPLSGTITLTIGSVAGSWSYNTTPTTPSTDPNPGSAPASTTVTSYDYSNHLNRIITALDQLVVIGSNLSSSLSILAQQSLISTPYLGSIADKQTTIADKQTTIADKQTTIADKQTTIADKQTAIETYQKKLKELGEDTGIHFVGPYDWIGLISMYRLLVEQGKILDASGDINPAQVAQALSKLETYKTKINDLPTSF